jgi:hypothetical protein
MQLKLKRSQKRGLLSGSPVFCLDARVGFTPEESKSIKLYDLLNQVVYNSDAAKRHLAAYEAGNTDTIGGALAGMAHAIGARMNLNLTIKNLQAGKHIECKSLEEMVGAEDAIMMACRNLKGFLDTAATFDGREILIDFADGDGAVIATSGSADPMLLAAPHETSWVE